MFEKLIVSDASQQRPRSRYFLVSSIVVGILFLSAVIFSIFAADIGLGEEEFEISRLLALTEPDTPKPEPPKRPQQANTTKLPERQANIARIDEPPPEIPPVSVVRNTQAERPLQAFAVTGRDVDPPPDSVPAAGGSSSNVMLDAPTATVESDPEKPAIDKPAPPPIPSRPRSIGVVNGIATNLPRPPYPQTAIAMGIEGKVDVQVTIDETGRVISARAASGHPFLKAAAETAAWSARFTPTKLSNIPVKVTGVIVYNFRRN